jgi:ATP-dependent Lon protease
VKCFYGSKYAVDDLCSRVCAQLKAIQDELGESDTGKSDTSLGDLAELKERIQQANLPPNAHAIVDREVRRLERMNPAQAEYTVTRSYLDWIVDLPWSKSTLDVFDLHAAHQQLEQGLSLSLTSIIIVSFF